MGDKDRSQTVRAGRNGVLDESTEAMNGKDDLVCRTGLSVEEDVVARIYQRLHGRVSFGVSFGQKRHHGCVGHTTGVEERSAQDDEIFTNRRLSQHDSAMIRFFNCLPVSLHVHDAMLEDCTSQAKVAIFDRRRQTKADWTK